MYSTSLEEQNEEKKLLKVFYFIVTLGLLAKSLKFVWNAFGRVVERKQLENCNEISANLPKLHSTRPAEKIEEKNGKLYTNLQFSDFQQENAETLEGKISAALFKLRFSWSEEMFKGKKFFLGTNTFLKNLLDLRTKRSDP